MKNKPFLIILIILVLLLFTAIILTPTYKKPVIKKTLPAKTQGTIAIVIDDWGYHLNNLSTLKEIKVPLTCAVLPNLKYSNLVANKLNSLGYEIILHLPMQPKEKYALENNTITLNMNEKQVQAIFIKDLSSVKFAKGVNNHMGSAITENIKMTTLVLTQIKKHNLYFLDSFVTAKSVCKEVATSLKIKFAKRDVFLDNSDDPLYIKNQLKKLKNLAKKNGVAIGIGHDRKNTLLVLKQMLPLMKEEGYRFVFVSQVTEVSL
ncbi:MAG: divergent polysaccharide deacetylase family protein [Candidatus Omnitrophota bacterium]